MIERTVDQMLKREFGSSLARFDVLAQLDRARVAALYRDEIERFGYRCE